MTIVLWPWKYAIRMLHEGDTDPSWATILKVCLTIALIGFIASTIMARVGFARHWQGSAGDWSGVGLLASGMALTGIVIILHPFIFLALSIATPLATLFGLGCLFVYGLPKRAHPPTPTPLTDRAERIRRLERELEIGGD